VWAWGSNECGQAGLDEDLDYVTIPQELTMFRDKKVKQVVSSRGYGMALTQSDDIYVWGNNEHGRLGLGPIGDIHVKPISFETRHINAVYKRNSETLVCQVTQWRVSWCWEQYSKFDRNLNYLQVQMGELGIHQREDDQKPAKIEWLSQRKCVDIAVGEYLTQRITMKEEVLTAIWSTYVFNFEHGGNNISCCSVSPFLGFNT
jgi:hypothetical protein